MKTQQKNQNIEPFRPSRAELNNWMKEQVIGTIASLDKNGQPQAATVAFSVANDGQLIIGTSEASRKSSNVDNDERVAMVITNNDERFTAQIEGRARKLAVSVFEKLYADEHYRQRPESLPFKDELGQCHILITPTSIRFSDCNPHPWVITEFNEN